MIAPPMIATLYATGAIAATPKRPSVFRTALASAPAARKIGAMSISRVSSTVIAVVSASKPGTSHGTMSGANTTMRIDRTSNVPSIRFATLDATRSARDRWPAAMSPVSTGMSDDPIAPAATSWNMRSGMRKAA